MAHFCFFGGPLLLQIWSNFAKIFTTCSIKIKNKQLFKNLVKVQIFAGTGRTQSLFFLSNFGPPFSHEDGRNKKKILIGKTVVIRLSKALSTLPFLGKIWLLFVLHWLFLTWNRAWLHVQRLKWIFGIRCCSVAILWQLNV